MWPDQVHAIGNIANASVMKQLHGLSKKCVEPAMDSVFSQCMLLI